MTERYIRRHRLFYLIAAALVPLLLVVVPAGAEDGAPVRKLLERMTDASRNLDYRGIFTYEHAGILKSIEVFHLVRDGVEYEKLLYLNGPRRQILRHGEEVDCPRPGQVLMHQLPSPEMAGERRDLAQFYDLRRRGEGRIADRRVNIVHLVPRDGFRYGHVFSLDRETGLLLQSLLIGDNKRVLERFQFVDISLSVPDADSLVAEAREHPPAEGVNCQPGKEVPMPARWHLAWVPPGFFAVDHRRHGNGIESLLYTDGLAVFSVFVDPRGGSDFPEMRAQRGATIAQIAKQTAADREYAVSVVGEIPPTTADRVASFVTFRGH
jgi:sigma-E factor negative regulatory protein RseB